MAQHPLSSDSAAALTAAGWQVLHLAGQGKGFLLAPAPPGEPAYVVLEYCDDMAAAYSAADAVVCRSGANTISELDPVSAAYTQVRVLESFGSAWPKDSRQPSMIVSSIPTQTADGMPTNFTIPDDWLKSPTGGVMIEVCF